MPDSVWRRYLVAAGTSAYSTHPRLVGVARDVKEIARFFAAEGYQEELLDLRHDPVSTEYKSELARWLSDPDERRDNDVIVVYYSGHGDTSGSRHFLLTADSGNASVETAVPTDFFMEALTDRPRTRRLLLILDTCKSGQGALNLAEAAARWAPIQWLDGEDEGVWVIAASRPIEEAEDGAFAEALVQAVAREQGHASPIHRFLSLDSIVENVNQILADRDLEQRACYMPASLSKLIPPYLQNHEYRPEVPLGVALDTRARLGREVATHWGPKGRGLSANATAGWYFTGRATAMRELVKWIGEPSGDNRIRVITSDPGSGKSAILGRIVILSDPHSRPSVPLNDIPADLIPPEKSLAAALLARAKTAAELSKDLALQLGTDCGLAVSEAVATLLRPPIIVIDALDEATNPRRVIEDLVVPLHEASVSGLPPRLIIATRRHWLDQLPADRVEIDLDEPPYLEPTDVSDYVASVLLSPNDPTSPTPYRHHSAAARLAGEAVAAIVRGNFLVAQIAAQTLVHSPVMRSPEQISAESNNWADVGRAFDTELARYGDKQTRVRDLITPLAWAQGAGLPREFWVQISTELTEQQYDEDDVTWAMRVAGAYIAEDLEDDRPVYRLYHKAFADHLRDERDALQVNRKIAASLISRVALDHAGQRRNWLTAHPHIRAHLPAYAASGRVLDDLVSDAGFLIAAVPERLLPLVHASGAPEARAAAAVYETVAHRLDRHDPGRAVAQLELAARQHQAASLALRIDALPYRLPWRTIWTNWLPPARNLTVGRHQESVDALAYGQVDGHPMVVSGSRDGVTLLWNLYTGNSKVLTGHEGAVLFVVCGNMDNGNSLAVTIGADETLRVWQDLQSEDPDGVVLADDIDIRSATSLAYGEVSGDPVAIAGFYDGRVRTWNLRSHEERTVHIGEQLTQQSREPRVRGVHVAPTVTGGLYAVTEADGQRSVWDLGPAGTRGVPLAGDTPDAWAEVAFGVIDGRPVVCAVGFEGGLRAWEADSGRPCVGTFLEESRASGSVKEQTKQPFSAHVPPFTALTCGEISERPIALTGRLDGVVQVHDLLTGRRQGEPFRADTSWIGSIAFGHIDDRPVVITGSGDGWIRALDLEQSHSDENTVRLDTGGTWAVTHGRVEGHRVVIAGNEDGTLVIHDLLTGNPRDEPLQVHKGPVWAVAYGHVDGTPVALTGGIDGTVQVHDLRPGRFQGAVVNDHLSSVRGLAYGRVRNRPVAITGGFDGAVRIWDLGTGQLMCEPMRGHAGGVWSVSFGWLDRRAIAVTAGDDGTVRVWDVLTGKPNRNPLRIESGAVGASSYAQIDGRPVILAAGDDNKVRVWDVRTGQLTCDPVTGHAVGPPTVTYAEDGHETIAISGWVGAVAQARLYGRAIAMSAGDDGQVRLWDPQTSHVLDVIDIGDTINGLAVSADGKVAVASMRGIVSMQLALS